MNDRFANWDKFIDPRIEQLKKGGFCLEAFYLCSAIIEFLLQASITTQEKWISVLLKESQMKFISSSEDLLKEKTLGQLINIFSKYCNDNLLISELNNFNSFRITLVHKLLDQDIIVLNDTAKLRLVTYNKLVSKLSRYSMKINEKQIRSSNRKIKVLSKKLKNKLT